MFLEGNKISTKVYNGLILMAVIVVSVVVALALVRFRPIDNGSAMKATLDLKRRVKPATAASSATATPATGNQ